MENIAEIYLEKLENVESDPGKILYALYLALFDMNYSVKSLRIFRKLNKIYGRRNVYFALLQMHDSYYGKEIDHTNIYPLIAFFIKKYLEKKNESVPAADAGFNFYIDSFSASNKSDDVIIPEYFGDET